MAKPANKPVASNRRARHEYEILDTVEAGIVLTGSEVKSLRAGQVQLADSYARVRRGEMWLEGVHVPPYQFAVGVGAHDPDRVRKLLLKRSEIEKLSHQMDVERVSLIPLSIYFKDGYAKVELAVAKGRTKGDKRQAIAERDAKRDIEREMGRRNKYQTR